MYESGYLCADYSKTCVCTYFNIIIKIIIVVVVIKKRKILVMFKRYKPLLGHFTEVGEIKMVMFQNE